MGSFRIQIAKAALIKNYLVRIPLGNKSPPDQGRPSRRHPAAGEVGMEDIEKLPVFIFKEIAVPRPVLTGQPFIQDRVPAIFFPGPEGAFRYGIAHRIIRVPEIVGGIKKIIPAVVL